MEEKRKDLKASKQLEIVKSAVTALSAKQPDFYYLSTIELAAEIKAYIHDGTSLAREDYAIVGGLTRRDIQILLSLHH